MKIEFTIKGVTLNEWDMLDVKRYYEAACTANRILDMEYNISDDAALQLGYQVRLLMAERGSSESDAIDEIMNTRKDLWQNENL